MNKATQINDFQTKPEALRKAEIARLLKTVNQAPFNLTNKNKSDRTSFKKRSLLDIALESSNNDDNSKPISLSEDETSISENNATEIKKNDEQDAGIKDQNQTIDGNQESESSEISEELIEKNNLLSEEKLRIAEELAYSKGREEGLTAGHINGLAEARAQAQEGLDAAVSIFRIAAETINSSDDTIIVDLQNTIEQSILGIAEETAGFLVDTLPEKFIDRIADLTKLINENINQINLDMNELDYKAIKEKLEKDDNLSSIKIRVLPSLQRGDMKLSSNGIRIEDFYKFSKMKHQGTENQYNIENSEEAKLEKNTQTSETINPELTEEKDVQNTQTSETINPELTEEKDVQNTQNLNIDDPILNDKIPHSPNDKKQ